MYTLFDTQRDNREFEISEYRAPQLQRIDAKITIYRSLPSMVGITQLKFPNNPSSLAWEVAARYDVVNYG